MQYYAITFNTVQLHDAMHIRATHVYKTAFFGWPIKLWKFVTTLLAITRLLNFWVHYPTLPYPKVINHYPSGPADHRQREGSSSGRLHPTIIHINYTSLSNPLSSRFWWLRHGAVLTKCSFNWDSFWGSTLKHWQENFSYRKMHCPINQTF